VIFDGIPDVDLVVTFYGDIRYTSYIAPFGYGNGESG